MVKRYVSIDHVIFYKREEAERQIKINSTFNRYIHQWVRQWTNISERNLYFTNHCIIVMANVDGHLLKPKNSRKRRNKCSFHAWRPRNRTLW